MAAPNPRPRRDKRELTDAEIREQARGLMSDPEVAGVIAQARASRARGESVRLEDALRPSDG
jgi:hypothetical protein